MADAPAKLMQDIQLVVTLPFDLLERTERLVERGYARNRDTLLTAAIEKFIAQLEEQIAVDADLLTMSADSDFQTLNLQIAEAFSESDYQALRDDENEAG